MTPFRPRNPDENMTVYLNAKQAYESGSNMNQTPTPQLPQTNPTLGISYAPGFVPVQPTPVVSPQPTQTPQPTPQPTPTPPVTPPVPPTTPIQGSIVDYLNSQGQPSDFNTRAGLAQQYGIQGYSGTAQQNIQLLNSLQGGTQPPKDVSVEGGDEIIQEGEQETLPPEEDYSNNLKDFLSNTYGIDTSNLGADFSDPVASIKKIIEEVMTSTGMPQVKTQMEAIAKAKLDLENKMAEEIASVNDNPWLSEGLRQKKVQAVKDTYETKINNQVNEFNLLQDMYDSAKQESQYAATLATNMYQNNREFLQGQLEFMTNAAEKAASAKTSNLDTSIQEINGQKVLVNNQTGETIKVLGTAGGGTSSTELLSPSEAVTLGVPYGTTKGDAAAKGIIPTSQKQKDTLKTLSKADVIISQIEKSIDGLDLANSPIYSIAKGSALNTQALLKTNTNAVAYKSLKEGLLAQLARASGEVGVLTDQDINRARSLLPTFFDTKETAKAKIDQLKSFFADLKSSASGQSIYSESDNDPLGIM